MEAFAKIKNSEKLFTVSYMQLYRALSEYKNVGNLLKPSEFYHLHPHLTKPVTSSSWPDKIPSEDEEGMYFFFDAYEHLIYIGYANHGSTIKGHLSLLFSFNPKDGSCVVKGDAWPSIPGYLVTLPIDKSLGLDPFLITAFLMETFSELPTVNINLVPERTFTTPVRKTYPLWQYLMIIPLVPLGVVIMIFLLVISPLLPLGIAAVLLGNLLARGYQ